MTRTQLFPAELEEATFERQGVIMELLSNMLSAAQANALCNSLSRLVLLAYRTLTVAAKLHIVGKGEETCALALVNCSSVIAFELHAHFRSIIWPADGECLVSPIFLLCRQNTIRAMPSLPGHGDSW